MTSFKNRCLVTLLLLAPQATVSAQRLAYQATEDTMRYLSVNTYRLYFIQGTDTLGSPVTTRTMESRMASAASGNLTMWVRLEGMDESTFRAEENYTVDPSGRLLAVAGQPFAEVPNARVDLLPRFPSPPNSVAVGLKWTDSVSLSGEQPYGSTSFEVRREYRVERLVDTLGTSVAEIVGLGQMRLRQGGWQNQARKQAWWQEVAGPVVDTVYFDVRHGVLVASVATMDLVGRGGAVGGPALASGLHSSIRLGPK
jgi:hypothetical protein